LKNEDNLKSVILIVEKRNDDTPYFWHSQMDRIYALGLIDVIKEFMLRLLIEE